MDGLFFEVMHMLLLKIVALLAFALFLVPALVLASAGTKHRHPLQVSLTHQWSDLSSLSVEDVNRRTLKAADAIRGKHKERWLANRLAR
jgi:hypothetical protein